MPTIAFTLHSGEQRLVQAYVGQTVMLAATAHGLAGIDADCGGVCSCATCHVIIDSQWLEHLDPPDSDELELLEFTAIPRQAGSRLSCQITMTDKLDRLQVSLVERQV